ncbi:AraC family transcriptional regulator ligand-binding domain-containing protein [Streptomyces mobaraensis NBRC 13819 = DSM 40847]|uniref:AraC family transcriptional regulator n=2 Tax=Streptomyces mobaraensis TaxID=35621 RepID=A0A5N5WEF7_STRMB|nr:AraC family transcriptional regulator ligand-binding domain-containing protein [Streptomyces mobaraensis]EME96402.1 AraC family transcriptional regulator [Streptomyces mobaraensis NBRC 13819 = DSM 40847]KAB7851271.1 AraC family transcriptional regulator [Streptomyces mobaraensis]QTT75818.1 AraC family transcriptional regulator ligand-binding domain-containing protein [Streptomyces mobaraensis NBRC 13819 = DSM 40847]
MAEALTTRTNGELDSIVLSKFLLTAAAANGADPDRIAREAGVPDWALAEDEVTIPARRTMHVWELVERALDTPDSPVSIAGLYSLGALGLFDYLFVNAPTLGAAMETSTRYLHFITTNGRFALHTQDERETTFSFHYLEGEPRQVELAEQFALAVLCARSRGVTGTPVHPLHVGFSQRAPRRHANLADALAAERGVDFGQDRATVTFRTADLARPVLGADPRLGAILSRYAATLPPPPPADWRDQFRQALDTCLAEGPPALDHVARRLTMSRRTLQRRLAESGTTWRTELDAARRRQADLARRTGHPTNASLADRLGYSDPRSLRRAVRRWSAEESDERGEGGGPTAGA